MSEKTLLQTASSRPKSPVREPPQAETVVEERYVSIHYTLRLEKTTTIFVPSDRYAALILYAPKPHESLLPEGGVDSSFICVSTQCLQAVLKTSSIPPPHIVPTQEPDERAMGVDVSMGQGANILKHASSENITRWLSTTRAGYLAHSWYILLPRIHIGAENFEASDAHLEAPS